MSEVLSVRPQSFFDMFPLRMIGQLMGVTDVFPVKCLMCTDILDSMRTNPIAMPLLPPPPLRRRAPITRSVTRVSPHLSSEKVTQRGANPKEGKAEIAFFGI